MSERGACGGRERYLRGGSGNVHVEYIDDDLSIVVRYATGPGEYVVGSVAATDFHAHSFHQKRVDEAIEEARRWASGIRADRSWWRR